MMAQRLLWKRLVTAGGSHCKTHTATALYPCPVSSELRVPASAKPYSEVPGPRQLPLVGNAWRFLPLIGHMSIERLDEVMWSLHRQYGRIVKVGGLIGHPDLVFVFHPDDVEKVFRREEALPHRPCMPSLRYYKHLLRRDFFGESPGVIGVHGKQWDEFRSRVQGVLLQVGAAKRYVTHLDQIASDFLLRVDSLRNSEQELPGDFLGEIYKWALESIGRVALDTRLGCLEQNVSNEAQRIISSIHTFFVNVAEVELRTPFWRVWSTPSFKKYIHSLDDFREMCTKLVMEAMVRLQKKEESQQQDATEEDRSILEKILDKTGDPKAAAILALDLFLVGVDTTSVAVTSTLYQLARNPEKQELLFQELSRVMPTPDTPLTPQHLEKLPYLKACIKETLRMYPVIIGNGRSLQSEVVVCGYRIPKGTHVIFPHLVVSNKDEYFPQHKKFIPERWIKSSPCAHKIHPFASLPFGYGRRTCLGRRFAEVELQILLAKMFRRYRVEYHYEEFRYKICPTYIPENPLQFRLVHRSTSCGS